MLPPCIFERFYHNEGAQLTALFDQPAPRWLMDAMHAHARPMRPHAAPRGALTWVCGLVHKPQAPADDHKQAAGLVTCRACGT